MWILLPHPPAQKFGLRRNSPISWFRRRSSEQGQTIFGQPCQVRQSEISLHFCKVAGGSSTLVSRTFSHFPIPTGRRYHTQQFLTNPGLLAQRSRQSRRFADSQQGDAICFGDEGRGLKSKDWWHVPPSPRLAVKLQLPIVRSSIESVLVRAQIHYVQQRCALRNNHGSRRQAEAGGLQCAGRTSRPRVLNFLSAPFPGPGRPPCSRGRASRVYDDPFLALICPIADAS